MKPTDNSDPCMHCVYAMDCFHDGTHGTHGGPQPMQGMQQCNTLCHYTVSISTPAGYMQTALRQAAGPTTRSSNPRDEIDEYASGLPEQAPGLLLRATGPPGRNVCLYLFRHVLRLVSVSVALAACLRL